MPALSTFIFSIGDNCMSTDAYSSKMHFESNFTRHDATASASASGAWARVATGVASNANDILSAAAHIPLPTANGVKADEYRVKKDDGSSYNTCDSPSDGNKVWYCSGCGDGPLGDWQPCCTGCGHAPCGECRWEEAA